MARKALGDDVRGEHLAGAPLVLGERVAREVPVRDVRRDRIVRDLPQVGGQLGARGADDRHRVALVVVRRAEHVGERLRVAGLGVAVGIEAVRGLVAAHARGDQLVDARGDARSIEFGDRILDRLDALALVVRHQAIERIEHAVGQKQLVGRDHAQVMAGERVAPLIEQVAALDEQRGDLLRLGGIRAERSDELLANGAADCAPTVPCRPGSSTRDRRAGRARPSRGPG